MSTPVDDTAARSAYATQQASFVSTSVNHPRLTKTDAESIRIFLLAYEQYAKEVTARAQQLVGSATSEATRPVNLKFCVDAEYLESTIALGFIDGVEDYDSLDDKILRAYLNKKAKQSKESVSLPAFDLIVERELKMDMSDKDATSRVQNLFVSYHSLLRRNGLSWLLTANPKVAVYHVLSAIRPANLKERLRADLQFAYCDLRKDFRAFLVHAEKLSDAFQLVDSGPKKYNTQQGSSSEKRGYAEKPKKNEPYSTKTAKPAKKRDLPACLFLPCVSAGRRHLVKDCTFCSEVERKTLFEELARRRAQDGPAKSTRGQKFGGRNAPPGPSGAYKKQSDSGTAGVYKPPDGTTGRIQKDSTVRARQPESPSIDLTLTDGEASTTTVGRCDDGSDDSIVSSKLAEDSCIQGIGKISAIQPVILQVALKNKTENISFKFSRTWIVPRVVLHLTAGQLALVNVSFLVADDDLACEELLIGLPVLRHLQVDTKTLLEHSRAALDGADCSSIGNPTTDKGGKLNRLMVARMNHVRDEDEFVRNHKIANRPHVNFDDARRSDDPFPDPSLLDPIDSIQHEEVQSSVNVMVEKARLAGLPQNESQRLEKLVREYTDIFRIAFSRGPPADIKPLRIVLTPDARPVRVRLRNYSKDQQEFLSKFVNDLVQCGLVYSNPTAAWASAPLLVYKPGPAKWRFTVDLRPVNKYTVKHQYPMPNVENELTKLHGSSYFATFDLSHGYWQLELESSSQELQSFVTPSGIYSPTRVLHGSTNAVAHLQSSLAEIIPQELQSHLLCWLDDILLYASSTSALISAIQVWFTICAKHNIKLHPDKCVLYATSIRWCGRVVTAAGVRFDPGRLTGLLEMEPPVNGMHLQQFVCALQWVRQGIPNFCDIISPLHDFMERVYDQAGKRTKGAVAKVLLTSLGWGQNELKCFEACKKALAHQTTLAHRDESKRLCVYTDASDAIWSGMLTQVPTADVQKAHIEQRHEPLAFLSGRFNDTQMGWSVLEKEAYAVMATLERMHWIVSTPSGFDLFTDHNNLIFLFDPLAIVPDLSQTSLRKVLRWAVRFSMYNYTCLHIKGTDNVWADLLGRWSAPATIRRIVQVPALPSAGSPEFDWPTSEQFVSIQAVHEAIRPSNLQCIDGLWKNPAGAIWVPDDASDLQLRLCIIAHTGPGGHRGRDSTEHTLRQSYFWSTVTKDVRSFVRACIHCISTTGGAKVPRPFGPAVHGTKANDLIQFDYIEIGPSKEGLKYVLMVRDDHSDYKWFFAFAGTTAENAAHAIIDWCASFGVPGGLMSDGPSHFKNETIRLITKGLKVPHHFTLPYCPWSNGAVERLGKELLRTFRAIVSELQMNKDEWPDLLPIIQSILNNAPSPQRAGVAPVTAFLGREPTPPISTFLRSYNLKPISAPDILHERAFNIRALQDRCAELHPIVQNAVSNNRQKSREHASSGRLANFTEGDFVLVARENFTAGEKLCLRWRGPRRILKAQNDHVYQVEDLRNGTLDDVHASRLKFYHDGFLDIQAIMSHVLSSETGMPVGRLMGLVDGPDGLLVHVRWKGLPPSEDTHELLGRVYEDVPDMLLRLLSRKNSPPTLVAKARSELGL